MSRKQEVQSGADESFVRAFYDALADLEIGNDLYTSMEITRTRRKGVLLVKITAYLEPVEGYKRPVATYSVEYPNATASTLSAALYQASVRFCKVVDDALLETHTKPDKRAP